MKFPLIQKGRTGEPEPGVFGSLEPEPQPAEKKTGAGAALKKKPGPEPQKICKYEIVHLLLLLLL